MEILAYIQFAFIGYIVSIFVRNKRISNAFLIASFFVYSSVSRFSGFDIDILEYSYAMHSDKLTIYYLKEPVFWIGSRILYDIFESEEIVFIIYDLICFYVVLKSLEIINKPKYIAVMIFVFFPSVMGLQNVYRQFVAVSFLLSSLFLCKEKPKTSWVMFVVAVFSQNSVAIFLPLIFHLKNRKYLSYICSIFVLGFLPLAIGTKSSSDTGNLGPEVYLIVLCLIFSLSLLLISLSTSRRYKIITFPFVFLFTLVGEAMFLMGTGQSKRVGMMSLLIYLFIFVGVMENVKTYKQGLRFMLFIFCLIPTFIFSSTMQFFR